MKISSIPLLCSFSLIFGLLLSSCASPGAPAYAPPTKGPTAKIKFTTAGTRVGAIIFDDETLTNPRWVGGGDEWVVVPAEKPLVVRRGFTSGPLFGVTQYETDFLVSFVPEKDGHYEMQYGHGMPMSVLRLMPLTPDGQRIQSQTPKLDASGKTTGFLPVFLPLKQVIPPKQYFKWVGE